MRPILGYRVCVSNPHTQGNFNKIEKVQRRACRFVSTKTSDVNATKLLRKHKSTSLCKRKAKQKLTLLESQTQKDHYSYWSPKWKSKEKQKHIKLWSSTVDAHLQSTLALPFQHSTNGESQGIQREHWENHSQTE